MTATQLPVHQLRRLLLLLLLQRVRLLQQPRKVTIITTTSSTTTRLRLLWKLWAVVARAVRLGFLTAAAGCQSPLCPPRGTRHAVRGSASKL
jgi:hypothetical protein